MKFFIPTYNRAQTIRTHKLFPNWKRFEPILVFNNEEQKREYMKNEELMSMDLRMLVSESKGITGQRRFILDQVEEDEWFCTADDNIRKLLHVNTDIYGHGDMTKEQAMHGRTEFYFDEPMTEEWFWEVAQEMMKRADEKGYKYAGFSTIKNPGFRAKKWSEWCYVISKLAFIKKSHITYDPNLEAMEDYGWTLENLREFGGLVRNNRVLPVAGHYEAGGIGKFEERLPRKLIDCEYLKNKYPGMVRQNAKSKYNAGELIINPRKKTVDNKQSKLL